MFCCQEVANVSNNSNSFSGTQGVQGQNQPLFGPVMQFGAHSFQPLGLLGATPATHMSASMQQPPVVAQQQPSVVFAVAAAPYGFFPFGGSPLSKLPLSVILHNNLNNLFWIDLFVL